MQRKWNIISASLFVPVIFSSGCFAPADPSQNSGVAASASKCLVPADADRTIDEVLELVNLERAQRDLQPVIANDKLTAMANEFACRMVDGKFFGHQDPQTNQGPGERAVTSKYVFFAIGENLAAGQRTAAEVMRVWMSSDSHRDIILDPTWREIGIAVRGGGELGLYWVQEFGDPAGL